MSEEQPATVPPRRPLAWTASPAGKAGMILVLLLLLQIPLFMVSGLIDERQARQNGVLADFRHGWGPAQTVSGPVLAVPYIAVLSGNRPSDTSKRERGWVRIPASQLSISARLEPETRKRGLFHAVVYTASLGFTGTVTIPRIDVADALASELLWNEAVLVTAADDLRGQPADSNAEVSGHAVVQTVKAMQGSCGGSVQVSAQIAGKPLEGATIPFHTSLVLRGTQSLNLLPYGKQIDLVVSAPWQTPSFTGNTLPLNYEIDHAGFRANWRIGGDAVSGGWQVSPTPLCLSNQTGNNGAVGVDLLEPVPTYLMVSRAAKYGTLFLVLSFVTYFIFESVSRVRIHLAQYALLGLSVSLFALILIALAEPLGFTIGYVLSTTAVMAQASLYTLSVVGSKRLAATFAGILGLLFGFLYIVLSLETFALLSGTVMVFAALSVIMFVTRRLDWSRGGIAMSRRKS